MLDMRSLDEMLFRSFIFEHTKKALNEGFNDNIGRTNVQPVFELPKASVWFKLYDALFDFFLRNPKSHKVLNQYSQLKAQVDIDGNFSENICKKNLPSAISLYKENLPTHYTKAQHLQSLEKALHLYASNARGPMYSTYLEQLKKECISIWQNGRQQCEAISLTGHGCMYEVHLLPNEANPNESESKEDDEDEEKDNEDESIDTKREFSRSRHGSNMKSVSLLKHRDSLRNLSNSSRKNEEISNSLSSKKMPVKSHNSNLVSRGASNCGELQRDRKDPFDLKEANFAFYEEFNKLEFNTKRNVIKYDFEVINRPQNVEKSSDPLSVTAFSSNETQTKNSLSSKAVYMDSNENSPIRVYDNFKAQNLVSNSEIPLYRMSNSENQSSFLTNFNSWLFKLMYLPSCGYCSCGNHFIL